MTKSSRQEIKLNEEKYEIDAEFSINTEGNHAIPQLEPDSESEASSTDELHELEHDKSDEAAWEDESDEERPILGNTVPSVFRVKNKRALEEDEESDGDDVIFSKKILRKTTSQFLPIEPRLRIHNCCSANRERLARGRVTSCEFNPKVQMLMIGSYDTSLSFFKVDKKDCSFLRDRMFEAFPISDAKFTRDGEKVALTSMRSGTFRLYDVNSSRESRASQFQLKSDKNLYLSKIAMSPLGDTCALATSCGTVYLANIKGMERISTLICPGYIVDICFNSSGDNLYVTCSSGEVVIYDFRNSSQGAVFHRWTDFGNTTLSTAISRDKLHVACGTDSGHVNLYSTIDILKSSQPKPLTSLANLTTPVDLTLFHPRSEILAYASSKTDASLRMYHMQGQFTFQNVTQKLVGMRKPTSLGFSPNGKFLCVGQTNGIATLFSISHYEKY
ncbi:U3 snoRNP protein [Cichlidogyrus casuarinus]|uniref:U3 snoRNP protein n=1 Tax=Cichlidogyrus casuarinus TaxID=1844966 RepID=A0ABD2QL03_9PLAT